MGTRSENTGPNFPECKLGTSKAYSVFFTATALSGAFWRTGSFLCSVYSIDTQYILWGGVFIHGLASYLVQLGFSLPMRQEHWTEGVSRPGFEQIWYWGESTDLVFRTCEFKSQGNLFLFQSIKIEPIKVNLSKLICMSLHMQVHIQTLVRIQL